MSDSFADTAEARRQLYRRVWSTPGIKVAAQLGISDVALAKRCRKLQVPRPPRGYWAKLAAGQKPQRARLPRLSRPKTMIVEEAKAELTEPVAAEAIRIPHSNLRLHPIALELIVALREARTDQDKRRVLTGYALPKVRVSKRLISRVARAFHVIIMVLHARGVTFEKGRREWDEARFERGDDRLQIEVEEEVVSVEPEKPVRGARRSQFDSAGVSQLSGRLTFSIPPAPGKRKYQTWAECDCLPLEQALAGTINGICQYFISLDKQRQEEAEARRREELVREERERQEAKRAHVVKLREIASARAENLLRAAEWWRLHQRTLEVIATCKRRWLGQQQGMLTQEQGAWLEWARKCAEAMSPFHVGYPDAAIDGAFNPAAVKLGGPYPAIRQIPTPPTMHKIPVPEPQYMPWDESPPAPYPFWLRHRGR